MATGSDDSEFAEFNSSKVREELRRKRAKLKRKETSSGKGGGKSIRYTDGVRCYKGSKGEKPVDVNETENFTENLDIFQMNVVETQALNNLHVEVECADADRDLNDLLRQLTQESHLTGYSKTSEEYRRKESIWKTRATHLDKEWDDLRSVTTDKSLEHDRDTFFVSMCNICRTSSACIRCKSCKKMLCSLCDYSIHCEQVTHHRIHFKDGAMCVLLPTQFLNPQKELYSKDVAVPVFEPMSCHCCQAFGEMRMKCGTREIVLITIDGRFDLKTASFYCLKCNASREATNDEYISAGFWPATLTDTSYLLCQGMLETWRHLKHKSPGMSERKFIESLEERSLDGCRSNIINRSLFNRASREYDYNKHWIKKNVLRRRYDKCKACGEHPLACHCDGNVKLRRLETSKDRGSTSLLGDEMIAHDDDMFSTIQEIDAAIPPARGSSRCGCSTFKAARTTSSHYRGQDETGIVTCCCRHGIILRSANMYQGETYRHTLHLHYFAWLLGTLFFCNDVVCQYWPFAIKVSKMAQTGQLDAKYSKLTEQMKPFLGVFHGRTHDWGCRVKYNGHWSERGAATLGEEQEQCFARLSRYANVTKHMNKPNRNDHLSLGMLYWNEEKESKMIPALCKRLLNARKRAPESDEKLTLLLRERSLGIEDLPEILSGLHLLAELSHDKTLTPNEYDLFNLRKELEGECHLVKLLQRRIAKENDSCKGRTANRKAITQKKMRIQKLVSLINDESEIPVLDEHIDSGIFPWHDSHHVSVAKDYELIDTWMLKLRFEEEIEQCKKEMVSFINELIKTRQILEDDIASYLVLRDSISESKASLAKAEILKINSSLGEALLKFDISLTSVLNLPPDFLEESDYDDEYETDTSDDDEINVYDEIQ